MEGSRVCSQAPRREPAARSNEMRLSSRWSEVLPVVVLLAGLLLAAPARAGSYVLVSATGSGTASITHWDSSTDSWDLVDGYGNVDGCFDGSTEYMLGSKHISYDLNVTYQFWWLPDDGLNDEED